MSKYKRLTIQVTEEQYKFIKTLGLARYEGKFAQALRSIINEAMKNAPK